MPYKSIQTRREHQRRYYQEHVTEINIKRRQHYQEHAEEIKLKQRQYYSKNVEKSVAASRKYYQEHMKERKAYKKQYQQKHAEELKKYMKQWRALHAEEIKISKQKYYQEHADELKIKRRQYYKNRIKNDPTYGKKHYARYKGYYSLKTKLWIKYIRQATPSWADLEKIKEIYQNCPKGYEVDHIIPLRGKLVNGLHVPNNLQYLTSEDNRKKSNNV
jgi:hypothetical protein